MFALSALLWWLLTLFLAGWWLTRSVVAENAAPVVSEPPDPIVETVEKWAHDWERGRA